MPTDETQCLTCPAGTKPDTLRQSCLEIPAMFIEITSTWAIGAMTLSSTGMYNIQDTFLYCNIYIPSMYLYTLVYVTLCRHTGKVKLIFLPTFIFTQVY